MQRFDANPLITPAAIEPTRPDVDVYCTINPGAVWFNEEALLLIRVGERPKPQQGTIAALVYDPAADLMHVHRVPLEDRALELLDGRTFNYVGRRLLTSLSHLRIARSRDLRTWRIDPKPAIFPTTEWEAYGCEDARITPLEGRYYITYTAVSHLGINVMLAVTDDFIRFDKLGIILPTFNKDVCIFPQRVGGRYVCRHRPFRTSFNDPNIWTAWSPDLRHWGEHSVLHRPVPLTWQSERVGAGAPPIRTAQGWLEIFHGADANGHYALAAMLSELDQPDRLIGYSRPVLLPQEPYETAGVYGQCIFSSGLLTRENGRLIIFYGGADTITAAAETTVEEMIEAVLSER
jgi:beta-1,2-mannobiose phosphorylase / 1,2-beta-oligomannan phosphorylase